jgi:hypothetical protein
MSADPWFQTLFADRIGGAGCGDEVPILPPGVLASV